MNKIDQRFAQIRKSGRKGIIAYLTAGDPSLEITETVALAMAEKGIDLLELGVPFSDPIADGPIIQAASARALKQGVTLKAVLALAERLKNKINIPVLIMTYYNPIYAYGLSDFTKEAERCGLSGVIVPDLPYEENENFDLLLKNAGLHLIHFIAPTSSDQRIEQTVRRAGGFIYCLSRAGVTGVDAGSLETGKRLLARVRSYTDLPLALGFGISKPEQLALLDEAGDAVIIGSAFVRLMEGSGNSKTIVPAVLSYLQQFNSV